jgi:DNA repair exonuclease SbcCD ATPase subunit
LRALCDYQVFGRKRSQSVFTRWSVKHNWQEVKETILDAGYLEEYYQQCLEEMKKEEAESARNIRLLQQQQQDLEERIDQALEMMLDRRLPKDKLVSKLQEDEKRLVEITDELERYGTKTVPNQRDLDTFRQQLNEALDQDFDVRKTALHTLIRKIEVDEDGQLDFDFYLSSDVLASTPTAVHTIRRIIFQRKRTLYKVETRYKHC